MVSNIFVFKTLQNYWKSQIKLPFLMQKRNFIRKGGSNPGPVFERLPARITPFLDD